MTTTLSRGGRSWKAHELLHELAVDKPLHIDLELIARFCGVKVRYAPLSGCAAKLVGLNDKAIITVDSRSHPFRQRFSIGHELGHWMFDRGSAAFECSPRTFLDEWSSNNPETRANRFASELLMPEAMFREAADGRGSDWGTLRFLARKFQTSLTATAMRFVELSTERPFLLCFCRQGRRGWFVRSPGLSRQLFPLEYPASAAISRVLQRRTPGPAETVSAHLWFDLPLARQSTLVEETIRVERSAGESLTLLSWPNVRTGLLDDEDGEGCWWDDGDA